MTTIQLGSYTMVLGDKHKKNSGGKQDEQHEGVHYEENIINEP